MGSKIGSTRLYTSGSKTVFVASGSECPRIYVSRGRTVFVASGTECPRVNLTGTATKFKDDYSKGFRTSKTLIKAIFS